MPDSSPPFYTQVSILDRYSHAADPGADPVAVTVIVRMLRRREDLRQHFFRSTPSTGWARILWENGFFGTPPAPETVDGGRRYSTWDAQEFLIAAAAEVPDIVLEHVASIDAPAIYIAGAVRALRQLQPDFAEREVMRILAWLHDPAIGPAIADETRELMLVLAQADRLPAAFSLLRGLLEPRQVQGRRQRDNVTAPIMALLFGNHSSTDLKLGEALAALKDRDTQQVVAVLEESLNASTTLTDDSTGRPASFWWRKAIEDTDQDLHDSYWDLLLRALRTTLEEWVDRDATVAEPVVHRFLNEQSTILRRLALHLLRRASTRYAALYAPILADRTHLNDVEGHYELFLLLRDRYSCLALGEQEQVVAAILQGPPEDAVAKLAEWAQRTHGVDPLDYAQRHAKRWQRDRLWMIKEHLTGLAAATLANLIEELGKPDGPEWLGRSIGGWVEEVGPLTVEELSALPPDQLVEVVRGWRQDDQQPWGLRQVTYTGFAQSVARVVAADIDRYGPVLPAIALHRAEYGRNILQEFTKLAQSGTLSWDPALALCERLVTPGTSLPEGDGEEWGGWTDVRLAVVWLLRAGMETHEHRMPNKYSPRIRTILLPLLDDVDPEPKDDHPPQNWVGHKDPATLALNHVRPCALAALIQHACIQAEAGTDESGEHARGPGPQRLLPMEREILTRKLDRRLDSSWAVHSVYGRYLVQLYWLDQRWTDEHLDYILPERDEALDHDLFVAAWDSYVVFNNPYAPLLPPLCTKYERAMRNLAHGQVTRTHLEPDRHLARHVLSIYLHADPVLTTPEGQGTLIVSFFRLAPADARASAAWVMWRTCEEQRDDFPNWWPKVRALWAWRVQEATTANHPVDFDDEIMWFAHILPAAAEQEAIGSLWPLLEGMLPHLARSASRRTTRDPVEQYIRKELARDPRRAMQCYRLLCEGEEPTPWPYPSPLQREILEIGAADERSRPDTLDLIDALARHGHRQYWDIFQRYTS